jgi:small subunit ribosomal protein S6
MVVQAPGTLVKEVERRIKVTDGVIRFITVRVDEELRKAERRKGRRVAQEEKRKGRAAAKASASEDEGVAL